MVIREILDATDKEIQAHEQAILRLRGVKERILECCRTTTSGEKTQSKRGSKCQDQQGATRRAA